MLEIISCPELTKDGICGLPAEITREDYIDSTDGPIRHIGTLCLNNHVLFMPADRLGKD